MRTLIGGYELVWIDIFLLSRRNNSIYGWCTSGIKRYDFHKNSFSMSFFVAFSKEKLYGIMGLQCTVNSLIFGLFVKRLYAIFDKESYENGDKNLIWAMYQFKRQTI